ncbi:MAG: hypothetical protein HUK08_09290 [Bacteroidaceae bacterium]|nr:hypothetical protein [Bacteroidaceae bacterium]
MKKGFFRISLIVLLASAILSCENRKTRAEIEADFKDFHDTEVPDEEMATSKSLEAHINDNTDMFKGKSLEELKKEEEEAKKRAEEEKKKAEERRKQQAQESSSDYGYSSSDSTAAEGIYSESSSTSADPVTHTENVLVQPQKTEQQRKNGTVEEGLAQ